MIHPPLKLGTCSYRRHTRPHIKTEQCIEWREQHALPEFSATTENPIVKLQPVDDRDVRIADLTREVGMWKSKYEQLEQIYNKLADQWNVFQATSRPDNRNIQRAEGAGEAARKLAEVFLCLAYDTDGRELIARMLARLERMQGRGAGQEVEVSEKLVPGRG